MASINNELIKKSLNLYGDQSIYNNYCKIANKYCKIFNREMKDKKSSSDNQDKLRDDVKKWLFSQSLENRMKICTVENELFGKLLLQMYSYYKLDRTLIFKPKPIFYSNEENQFEKKTDINNFKSKFEDENNISHNNNNNTNIKVTRTNKSGKKIEAQIVGYSQAPLNNFKQEEIAVNNFGNFFTFHSYRSYNINTTSEDDNSNKKVDKTII